MLLRRDTPLGLRTLHDDKKKIKKNKEDQEDQEDQGEEQQQQSHTRHLSLVGQKAAGTASAKGSHMVRPCSQTCLLSALSREVSMFHAPFWTATCGPKEMDQPCLIHPHAISFVGATAALRRAQSCCTDRDALHRPESLSHHAGYL